MTTVADAHTAPPATAAEPHPDEPRRRRRGVVWLALGGVLVAATGAGAWLWATSTSTEAPAATAGPTATATVERGTISATESWDGTLEQTPFTVASGGEGTITRLAAQGQAVERGNELYRVNEQPVTLLSGVVPMYRDLGPGDSGVDVAQLEANLAELGYAGFTVDDQYTGSTADAVRAWQGDIGAEQIGTVARGDVLFLPQGGQVDALRARVGDVVEPGTPVLDITGTVQVVNLEADIDDRDRFEVDTEVVVVLPGGDEVAGTVSATAVVEVASDSADREAGGDTATESVVQVEIAVNENAPDEFVGAPVDVVVAVDERTDVLLVPVNALLALAEGGYGLEVVADDGSTVVAVETGLFADGQVEVSSADIAEGMVVGVAGR